MPGTDISQDDSLCLTLCEQAFSVMNINKSKLRSQLTHRHLNDIMKITTAQKQVPDVDKLVKARRCVGKQQLKSDM